MSKICIPFSPNWYLPQILSWNESNNLLAFGVNDKVHVLNKLLKIPEDELFLDIESVPNKLKVTSVLVTNDLIFAGYSNGWICVWNIQKAFQKISVEKLSMNQIQFLNFQQNELRIIDQQGKIVIIELKFQDDKINIISMNQIHNQYEQNKNQQIQVKAIQTNDLNTVMIYENGLIQIFKTQNMESIIQTQIQSIRVLYCDIKIEYKIVQIILVSKEKNKFFIQLYTLDIEKEDSLKQVSHKQDYSIQYKQDKNTEKASLCIKFLQNLIMFTGKLGEIYLISQVFLQENQKVSLKPFSMNTLYEGQGNFNIQMQNYQVVSDNKHKLSIFEVFQFQNQIITLSLDRLLVFWNYDQVLQNLSYQWDINCLSSKVIKLASSQLEKNTIFALTQDSNLKTLITNKKNNSYYSQTVQVDVKNLKIRDFIMHPLHEGILAFISDDRLQLGIFDIYQEQIVKMTESFKIKIFYINIVDKNFKNIICCNIDYFKEKFYIQVDENVQQKIKFNNKKSIKQLDNLVFIIFEDMSIGFWNLQNDQFDFYSQTKSEEFDQLNSIDILQFPNPQFAQYLIFGDKKGNLIIKYLDETVNSDELVLNNFCQSSVSAIKFNQGQNPENILCGVGSFDRKVSILKLQTHDYGDHLKISYIQIYKFKHKNPIIQLNWNSLDYILTVCYNHSTIQIWNANYKDNNQNEEEPLIQKKVKLNKSQEEEFQDISSDDEEFEDAELHDEMRFTLNREICNIRGHRGYVTSAVFSNLNPHLIASSSDDQTIKLWDTKQILNKKPPNKKKNKKKKNQSSKNDNSQEQTQQNQNLNEYESQDQIVQELVQSPSENKII